jgi:hypothetical protein
MNPSEILEKLQIFLSSTTKYYLPPDSFSQIQFCHWYINNLLSNANDITNPSDEAWFHYSSFVNSQNYNPQCLDDVWIVTSRRRIIIPIVFNETIDTRRYQRLLLEPFINQLDDAELTNGCFQQDSTTAHAARTKLILEEFFPGQLISVGLCSPFKKSSFRDLINNLQELLQVIENAKANAAPEMLSNVFSNLNRSVRCCLQKGGHPFPNLFFFLRNMRF